MNRPASGAARGRPARARRCRVGARGSRVDDAVGAVEVLVDVLDQVGGPHLREYVVGRVVVGLAGALGGLEPGHHLGRPGRRGRSAVDLGDPAAHQRQRRRVGCAGRERGDHPVTVGAVVLAAGHVDRRLREPGAARPAPAGRPRQPGTGRPAPSPRRAAPGPAGSGPPARPPGGRARRRTASSRASPPRPRRPGRGGARRAAGGLKQHAHPPRRTDRIRRTDHLVIPLDQRTKVDLRCCACHCSP